MKCPGSSGISLCLPPRLHFSKVRPGIRVITLTDKQVHDNATLNWDPSKLHSTHGFTWRGHEDSARKSFRLRSAWQTKREQALKTGKRMSVLILNDLPPSS